MVNLHVMGCDRSGIARILISRWPERMYMFFVKYRVLRWKIKDNSSEWFNKLLYFVLKTIRNKLLGKASVKLSLNIVRIIELYSELDLLKD